MPAAPPKPIKLGGDVFLVPAPKGMRSFALQQRIIPVASRILNAFLRLSAKEGSDVMNQEVMSVLPQAMPYLAQVFAEMPKGELEAITKELLGDATINRLPLFGGQEDAFDGFMAGRTLDTWALLWHALKIWYPDVFTKAGGLFTVGKSPESESKESTISPGSGQE